MEPMPLGRQDCSGNEGGDGRQASESGRYRRIRGEAIQNAASIPACYFRKPRFPQTIGKRLSRGPAAAETSGEVGRGKGTG